MIWEIKKDIGNTILAGTILSFNACRNSTPQDIGRWGYFFRIPDGNAASIKDGAVVFGYQVKDLG